MNDEREPIDVLLDHARIEVSPPHTPQEVDDQLRKLQENRAHGGS